MSMEEFRSEQLAAGNWAVVKAISSWSLLDEIPYLPNTQWNSSTEHQPSQDEQCLAAAGINCQAPKTFHPGCLEKVVALFQLIHQSDVTLGTMPPETPVVTLMNGTHVLVSNCISDSFVHDHLESLTLMPDHEEFKPEVLSVQITPAAFVLPLERQIFPSFSIRFVSKGVGQQSLLIDLSLGSANLDQKQPAIENPGKRIDLV